MAILAGSKVIAADLSMPDPVNGYGNGVNTITATAWADLPTVGCTASVTNPHPSLQMLCLVSWGVWLNASANAVRACPRVSGSITLAAGDTGIAGGWGMIPRGLVEYTQYSGQGTILLPVSATAATFTMQAYREAATGTQQANYPRLLVVPLRYV